MLLAATGTGKTLILAHNKTLAGQLYSEFKEMFPENEVGLFSHIMILHIR